MDHLHASGWIFKIQSADDLFGKPEVFVLKAIQDPQGKRRAV